MSKIYWRQNKILKVISDQKFMIRKINEKLKLKICSPQQLGNREDR